MAVVSKATQQSWWVPWEIGIATEKNYPLATYFIQDIAVPSFLKIWPALQTLEHLDAYADQAKKHRLFLVEASTMGFNEETSRFKAAQEFHRELKKRIRTIVGSNRRGRPD